MENVKLCMYVTCAAALQQGLLDFPCTEHTTVAAAHCSPGFLAAAGVPARLLHSRYVSGVDGHRQVLHAGVARWRHGQAPPGNAGVHHVAVRQLPDLAIQELLLDLGRTAQKKGADECLPVSKAAVRLYHVVAVYKCRMYACCSNQPRGL